MASTSIANDFDDTQKQCEEWLGRIAFFIMLDNIHTRGQRIGQAFMNSLTADEYNKLTGSLNDPFYRDDWDSIQRAIDYLLEN